MSLASTDLPHQAEVISDRPMFNDLAVCESEDVNILD
jgi:hypothetical protein